MYSFDIERHLEIIELQYGAFYRNFHHFDRVINEWKEVFNLVNREVRKPIVAKIHTKDGEELVTETYQQELVFDQERVFVFEWDIVLALYDLNERKQKMKEIELIPYLPFIDKTQLSFRNEKGRQPYLPVILLNAHNVLETHIVLNGNHRMVEAYQKGNRHVKGHYIQDLTHLKWMTSDFMQAMYEFLSDMRMIDYAVTDKGANLKHDRLYERLLISRLYPK